MNSGIGTIEGTAHLNNRHIVLLIVRRKDNGYYNDEIGFGRPDYFNLTPWIGSKALVQVP
jgi:hypothetical protein